MRKFTLMLTICGLFFFIQSAQAKIQITDDYIDCVTEIANVNALVRAAKKVGVKINDRTIKRLTSLQLVYLKYMTITSREDKKKIKEYIDKISASGKEKSKKTSAQLTDAKQVGKVMKDGFARINSCNKKYLKTILDTVMVTKK